MAQELLTENGYRMSMRTGESVRNVGNENMQNLDFERG